MLLRNKLNIVPLIIGCCLLVALNIAIVPGLSNKRISVLILLVYISFLFLRKKGCIKKEDNIPIYILTILLISALVGILLKNTEPGIVIFNLIFTYISVILTKIALDSIPNFKVEDLRKALLIAFWSCVIFFLVIIDFNLLNLIKLRSILIEKSVPINSTINQIAIFSCFFICLVNYVGFSKLFKIFSISILLGGVLFSLSRQNIVYILAFLSILGLVQLKFHKLIVIITLLSISSVFVMSSDINVDDFGVLNPIMNRVEKTSMQLERGTDFNRITQAVDSLAWGAENPVLGLGVGGFAERAKKAGYSPETRVPEAAINQLFSEHGFIIAILFIVFYFMMFLRLCTITIDNEYSSLRRKLIVFIVTFPILMLFNEIHYQSCVWVYYFLTLKIILNSNLIKS